MLKSIIYFSFLITIVYGKNFTCDPATDCMNGNATDLVPDPNDCTQYYFCVQSGSNVIPSGSSIPCPTGEYFDQNTTVCVNGTCPSSPCGSLTNSCGNYTCNDASSYYASYYGDCTKYYLCLASPVLESCTSPNLYFDGTKCVSDSSVCCDFCSSACETPYTQIPDPVDCTMYYMCTEAGPLSNAIHLPCSSGQQFDPMLSTCVTGSSCTPACSNSSISTTTSVIPNIANTSNPSSVVTGITNASTISSSSPSDCVDTYNCIADGNFPKCSTSCDPSYFACTGGVATEKTCENGNVFNPNPLYPFCVLSTNCPFPS